MKINAAGLRADIGGSLAKGTIVKKKEQDIDIFVSFDDEKEISKLSDFLDKTPWNIQKIHGSRDYFHILKDNLIIELIPVVSFDEPADAKNVTDFSMLHVKYVKNKINKNKKAADEIKLAKTFCHAQNCYGAESYIKGFSGYALELLVLHYGSFEKLLKAMIKTKIPLVVDPEKKFKGNPLKELNESKLLSPIILIDPTYKFRNVCAGLSKETFERFVSVAGQFIKKPSLNFFVEKKIDAGGMKKQALKSRARFIEFDFSTDKQEGDIAATKMKKFFEFIVSALNRKEQKVVRAGFEYENGKKAKGYLVVKENKEILMKGPPASMPDACKKFKRVHKNAVKKGGFLYAKQKISLAEIFNHLHGFEDEMDVSFSIKSKI